METAFLGSSHLHLAPRCARCSAAGACAPKHPRISCGKRGSYPVTGTQFTVLWGMKYAAITHIATSAGARYTGCKKAHTFCREGIDISEAVAK